MSRPLRVMLSADTAGGVWDFTRTLAAGLAADGHHVLLATLGAPTDAQLEALPREVAIEVRNDPLEWYPAPRHELERTARWIARAAEEWQADILHLGQMTYPALASMPAPTVVTIHSDVCSWFTEVRGEPPPEGWEEYAQLVAAGLSSAAMVTAPSAYQRDLAARAFGIRGRVVYNAAAPARRAIDPARTRSPMLLTAGRAWDEAKGIGYLDEALVLLGSEAPPTHLFGATEGPGGERFAPRALSAEGSASRSRLEGWMARATIYVAPSLYEPFGLATLEAAHHGCALLLSDIGSFRELWDGCACFAPRGDAAALAQSIRALASDPVTTARLGELARARALERFTPERFVRDHMELYRGLVDRALPSMVRPGPTMPT